MVCMEKHHIATPEEINAFIAEFPNWRVDADALHALYSLEDFATVMKVVEGVARAAEELHHHPSWCNEFNKLTFSLATHEVGNKVTDRDIELARAIEGVIAAHTR